MVVVGDILITLAPIPLLLTRYLIEGKAFHLPKPWSSPLKMGTMVLPTSWEGYHKMCNELGTGQASGKCQLLLWLFCPEHSTLPDSLTPTLILHPTCTRLCTLGFASPSENCQLLLWLTFVLYVNLQLSWHRCLMVPSLLKTSSSMNTYV